MIDPPGNGGAHQVERVVPGRQLAHHRGDEVMHRRVMLEREQFRHAHGARAADARQIVAHQIDDHQVLGAVLGALRQRLAEQAIVFGAEAARHRALDRPRLDMTILVHAQETLGRGADDGDVRRFEERGKGRGVANPHPPDTSPTATRSAAPRNAATGWSERCRRQGCTRGREPPRRDNPHV